MNNVSATIYMVFLTVFASGDLLEVSGRHSTEQFEAKTQAFKWPTTVFGVVESNGATHSEAPPTLQPPITVGNPFR